MRPRDRGRAQGWRRREHRVSPIWNSARDIFQGTRVAVDRVQPEGAISLEGEAMPPATTFSASIAAVGKGLPPWWPRGRIQVHAAIATASFVCYILGRLLQ